MTDQRATKGTQVVTESAADGQAAPEPSAESRFGYFVVQLAATPATPRPLVRGVLENLATGEKQAFSSLVSLTRDLEEWSGDASPSGDERFRPPE